MTEYKVYLDGVLMPLGISKLETNIKNRNDDVDLINGKVKSIIKDPGLTTWKFSVLLPTGLTLKDREIKSVDFYLSHFEKLKTSKKPFRFIVSRSEVIATKKIDGKNVDIFSNYGLGDTNVAVTLEDYKRLESAELGLKSEVEINLKQYAEYQPTHIVIKKPTEEIPVEPDNPEPPEPNPEPQPEPDYMVIVREELKRLEGKDLPPTFKVGFVRKQSQGGAYVNYYMSWKDVSKELFGSEKYWRGIRDTNPGKGNPEVNKEQPPELYPRHHTTLNIDKEAIVTVIAEKYPEDLE